MGGCAGETWVRESQSPDRSDPEWGAKNQPEHHWVWSPNRTAVDKLAETGRGL